MSNGIREHQEWDLKQVLKTKQGVTIVQTLAWENDSVIKEEWFNAKGQLHRIGAPAQISRDEWSGVVLEENYYENGEGPLNRSDDAPEQSYACRAASLRSQRKGEIENALSDELYKAIGEKNRESAREIRRRIASFQRSPLAEGASPSG